MPLTDTDYTLTDAYIAVMDFENAIECRRLFQARNAIRRLNAAGATFDHFELRGWHRVECSGLAWEVATLTIDTVINGTPVSVQVTCSRGCGRRRIDLVYAEVGARCGGDLGFSTNEDLAPVRAARAAFPL